jgi:hypothetical protein
MEALWHGFDGLTQGYYRRSKLHAVMLRRFLLLATLDPDSEMVKLLLYLMNVYLKCYSYFVKTILLSFMWCFTNWECLHNSPTNACSYIFIMIKYGVMEPPFMKQFFFCVFAYV